MAELAAAEQRLECLQDAHFVRGELGETTYQRLRTRLERDLAVLQERVERSWRASVALVPDPRRVWDEGDLAQRRELVRSVVERVVLLPARPGYNRFDPSKVQTDIPLLKLLEASESLELTKAGRQAYEAERQASWES